MEGKKSFVLYSDIIHTVKKLPNNKAGELFKLILSYVNDENPTTKDLAVDLVFEPIKQQLKRDLKQWEEIRSERSESGRIGGIKSGEARRSKIKQNEAQLQNTKQTEANEAVNGIVNVNDTVIVKRERQHENQFVCYDAEKEILKNQIEFERICAVAGKNLTEGAEILRNYHLYLEEKEQYPKGRKSVFSGFERWITNEKKFNKNGSTSTTTGGKHKGAMQLVSSLKQDFAARRKENT